MRRFGSPELQREYLAPAIAGDMVSSIAVRHKSCRNYKHNCVSLVPTFKYIPCVYIYIYIRYTVYIYSIWDVYRYIIFIFLYGTDVIQRGQKRLFNPFCVYLHIILSAILPSFPFYSFPFLPFFIFCPIWLWLITCFKRKGNMASLQQGTKMRLSITHLRWQ